MKRFISLVVLVGALLWVAPVLAAYPGYIPALEDLGRQDQGTALTLSGVVQIVVNALTMLLGLAITITIAMIVYGGFKMAWSRGVDAEFKKGKDILTNAVIGLVVILGTGIIINTIARFAVNPGSILW